MIWMVDMLITVLWMHRRWSSAQFASTNLTRPLSMNIWIVDAALMTHTQHHHHRRCRRQHRRQKWIPGFGGPP